MRNEIALRNSREIQNNQREEYTVEKIAQKIVDKPEYEKELQNGFDQVANKTRDIWTLDVRRRDGIVNKGDKIAYKENFDTKKEIPILATHTGIYECVLSKAQLYKTIWLDKGSVTFGKIYLPEYDFYKNYQLQIERKVEGIKKSQQQAIEIEEQSKKEEEQRKAEKLQKDQNFAIEDLDDLLKDLDKYILGKQEVAIDTLQEINSDLKVLYAQKENLKDLKSIEEYKSHFETAYKEAKKNPNLTDIIEQRMLDILITFFELIGENDIKNKIANIKAIGDEKKIAAESNEKKQNLDDAIVLLQTAYKKDKTLDFEQLKIIENIAIFFITNKSKIQITKDFEKIKSILDEIFKQELSHENNYSGKETLKRILMDFCEVLDKNAQYINDLIENQKKAESNKKFEKEFSEIMSKLEESIVKLQNTVENKTSIDFASLQIIETSLQTLINKKDKITNKENLFICKEKFDNLFDGFRQQENCSENALKTMESILDKFYEFFDISNEEKDKIIEERKKVDEEREFCRQKSAQSERIKKLSNKIKEIEIYVENNEQVKIEDLQILEDLLKEISIQKELIQDKAEIENAKIHLEAVIKDCKKKKNLSSSAKLRMEEIVKEFKKLFEKSNNGLFFKFLKK